MITNSLEWTVYRSKLGGTIRSLHGNRDLARMLINIDGMVERLSRLEVEARRTRNRTAADGALAEINSAIATLEQWIMVGAFLR